MRLQVTDKYIPQLQQLWMDVFGDEKAYTDLFFSGPVQNAVCLAVPEDGRIISALYLLDCAIDVRGTRYGGYYLYAAATAENCRRQGHMGKLIEEAKALLQKKEHAFIALVPATTALYAYYESFGFRTAMYLYEGTTAVDLSSAVPCTTDAYQAARAKFCNAFHWTDTNAAYVFSCLRYAQITPQSTGEGLLLHGGSSAEELLFCPQRPGDTVLQVRTPFPLPGMQKRPFGMIYTDNPQLKAALNKHEIYMNLALD